MIINTAETAANADIITKRLRVGGAAARARPGTFISSHPLAGAAGLGGVPVAVAILVEVPVRGVVQRTHQIVVARHPIAWLRIAKVVLVRVEAVTRVEVLRLDIGRAIDRKSTRLNAS